MSGIAGYPRPKFDDNNNPTHSPMALASRDSKVFAAPVPQSSTTQRGKKRTKKKKNKK